MARHRLKYEPSDPKWACDVCYRGYKTKAEAKACERRHVSRYVSEEMRTGKYPPKQAVAIGLSRARAAGHKVPRKKGHRVVWPRDW